MRSIDPWVIQAKYLWIFLKHLWIRRVARIRDRYEIYRANRFFLAALTNFEILLNTGTLCTSRGWKSLTGFFFSSRGYPARVPYVCGIMHAWFHTGKYIARWIYRRESPGGVWIFNKTRVGSTRTGILFRLEACFFFFPLLILREVVTISLI